MNLLHTKKTKTTKNHHNNTMSSTALRATWWWPKNSYLSCCLQIGLPAAQQRPFVSSVGIEQLEHMELQLKYHTVPEQTTPAFQTNHWRRKKRRSLKRPSSFYQIIMVHFTESKKKERKKKKRIWSAGALTGGERACDGGARYRTEQSAWPFTSQWL